MPPLFRPAVAACSFALVMSTGAVALAGVNADEAAPTVPERAPRSGAEPAASDTARAPRPRRDAKRFVVARDFGVVLPVGELAESAAAMYGPVVRLGFHVTDSFEIAVRAGYQRGVEQESAGTTHSLSSMPMHAGGRWFVFGNREYLYAGLELGANVLLSKWAARESFFDVSADAARVRPSANAALGFVWSRSVPIDLRTELSAIDLLAKGGPANALAVGVTAGYSIFF